MAKGFHRLRIVTAASVAGAGLVPVAAGGAAAAVFSNFGEHFYQPLGGSGHISEDWSLGSNATKAFGATKPAFGIAGVHLSRQVIRTASPSTAHGLQAFAGVQIGSTSYRPTVGVIDRSAEPTDVLAPARSVGRVKVSMKVHFVDGRTARVLILVKNPGTRTVTKNVSVGSFMSQLSTDGIQTTSSGDTLVSQDDSWFIAPAHTISGDQEIVPVTIARGNANNGALTVRPGGGEARSIDTYRLRIRPHRTVALLYFAQVDFSASTLSSKTPQFHDGSTLTVSDLAGLSNGERKAVRNWTGIPLV